MDQKSKAQIQKALDIKTEQRYTFYIMKDPIDVQYNVKYQNAKGKVKTHNISAPFDSIRKDGDKVGFVAYSYGKGIRSFRNDRVLDMQAVDASS